jgi:hypothetical protein
MFQFSRFASHSYVFTMRYPKRVGFPIQKFWSITVFITLTRLIAD